MPDIFTEVTRRPWGSRVGGSIGGAFLGVLLALGGMVLLFWNEGRTIHMKSALDEARRKFVVIPSETVQAANEGKLVYLTGNADTTESLNDPLFGVSAKALKMERNVQTFQWEEESESHTEKKLGGSEEKTTTYTYAKKWTASLIDSSKFKQSTDHYNPPARVQPDWKATTHTAHIGDFHMPEDFIEELKADDALNFSQNDLSKVSPEFRASAHIGGAEFYLGNDPGKPEIGDQRFIYKVLRPTTISLLAMQSANSFRPYTAKSGVRLKLIHAGNASADSLLDEAEHDNESNSSFLRLAGFALLFFGFWSFSGPLNTLADIVPFVGGLLRVGTGLLALLGALIVGCVTIAVATFAYHPVFSGVLIAAALVSLYITHRSQRKAADR